MPWRLNPDHKKSLLEKLIALGGRPETTLEAATRAKYGEAFPRESARRLFETDKAASEKNKRILFAFYCGLPQWKAGTLTSKEEDKLQAAIKHFTIEEKIDRPPPPPPGPENKNMHCMIIYSKLLYLRDIKRNEPAYKKYIVRLDREIDVFDEFIVLRTMQFKNKPSPFSIFGRRPNFGQEGDVVTNMQPIFPPRTDVMVADKNWEGISNVSEHFEQNPELLWQGAFTIINGFQRGNEFARLFPIGKCDRAVLILDLTSVPAYCNGNLLNTPPIGHCIRTNDDTRIKMHVEQAASGAFILDTQRAYEGDEVDNGWIPGKHIIENGDNFEMQFSVNWDVVAEASPKRK